MTALKIEQTTAGLEFWLRWWLASGLGFFVGGMLAIPIGFGLGEMVQQAIGDLAGYSVGGALFGLCWAGGLGLAQAAVLASRIERAWRWAVASILGGVIGWTLFFTLLGSAGGFDRIPESVAGLVAGTSLGLALGLSQWLILRRCVSRAGWWVLASVVGLALCMFVAFLMGGEGRELIALSLSGLLAGPLTGLALVWLLRQQR